jgi:hypothetical protein
LIRRIIIGAEACAVTAGKTSAIERNERFSKQRSGHGGEHVVGKKKN